MTGVSRRNRHGFVVAISTSVLLLLTLARCGDDDDDGCASGVPCVCSGARGCIFDCEESGCMPQCDNVDFCSAHCGGACDYTCHNVHQCSVGCGSNCDVSCQDVSECIADVGSGSCVRCDRLSNCDVNCTGECEVRCANVPESSCVLKCADGALPTDCGNGVFVCGRSCPSGNDSFCQD